MDHRIEQIFVCNGTGILYLFLQVQIQLPFVCQLLLQGRQVPLLLHRFGGNVLAHQILEAAFAQRCNLPGQILGIQNGIALLINHFTLVVGYVVILQQLLAHVKVARLNLALCALDAARHNAGFNGFTIGHLQAVHDGLDAITGEDAHQRVIQTQIEARRAWVALAAGTATQLVVDTA